MQKTKFMEVMFSAVDDGNEELTNQVAGDIESAKENGQVDTDEVTYINLGDDKVMVIDNVNNEATVVEGSGEEYEMEALPDDEIEKYIHTLDGTQPDDVKDADIENVSEHVVSGISGASNPEELQVQAITKNSAGASDNKCPECEEEREFSVSTRNSAVLRFFSDQAYYEKIMSDVLDSEDTAVVGNIQVDKVSDDEVVITDKTTGDQAKVAIDGDELEVEELSEKNFKEFSDLVEAEEGVDQYEPMFVVGIAPDSHVIVDAPVYTEEDAQDLADHLDELGVVGARIFENPDEAREYAQSLLSAEDAVEADEPEQAEFSDRELYLTRYYSESDLEPEYSIFSDPEVDLSDCTQYMIRMFSEAEEGITETQDQIEDAISSGEQIEDDNIIITPISQEAAVIEDKDNGEFTVATLTDEDINVESISEDEADELTGNLEVEGQEPEQAEFSATRFMHRLFSEENDELPVAQNKVEDAIKNGDQIEDEDVVITPVDSETAVVEDKKNDEITKVTLGEDGLNAEAISEDEADKLLEDVEVDEDSAEESEEREFSQVTRFMHRLFSEVDDEAPVAQGKVEDAIESGEQIEDDGVIITPIDSETAVVEDKKNDEITKVTLVEGGVDAEKISEDEADELLKDVEVDEDSEVDEDETPEEKSEREFSERLEEYENMSTLERFFADASEEMVTIQVPASSIQNAVPEGQVPLVAPSQQGDDAQAQVAPQADEQAQTSAELIEDKAIAAVNSIQEAAQQAAEMIQEAKAAPAPGEGSDIQEAQFSDYNEEDERMFAETSEPKNILSDPMAAWLSQI